MRLLCAAVCIYLFGFSMASPWAKDLHNIVKRQSVDGGNGEGECSLADIIFVVDGSGSIGATNWPKVLQFLVDLINVFEVGDQAARFGSVSYGNRATKNFDLNQYNDKDTLQEAVRAIAWKDQATNTSGGIRLARSMFNAAAGDRPNAPNLMVVLTDGESNRDEILTVPEANNARDDGIIVFAIGIGSGINQGELEGIGNKPVEDFVFQVDNFDVLDSIQDQLVQSACVALAACTENADIVFVLDSSGSVGNANFQAMKAFINDLLEDINVGPAESHVAVVSYSDNAVQEFGLETYTENRIAVQEAVAQIQYMRGTTNTAAALRMVREQTLANTRNDFRDIVVVFTDGNSNNYEQTLEQASRLRLSGATILVAAVTDWVDMVEIGEIASDPDSLNVFAVEDFDSLGSIKDALKKALCNDQNACGSIPCQNGGTCVSGINIYFCLCPPNFAGVNCELPCSNPKDVIVTMDASSSIGRVNFARIEDFVKGLARTLPISQSHTHMGVQMFSTNPERKFDINTYMSKKNITEAVSFEWTRGETNSAGAIRSQTQDMFRVQDRQNAENVGIFFSDGHSRDRSATFEAAVQAHENDIRMIAVGVNVRSKWDQRELRAIATNPNEDHIFLADRYEDLPLLTNSVVEAVCNDVDNCNPNPCGPGQCIDGYNSYRCICTSSTTGKNCERGGNGEADIVFVVDMSGSIRRERFIHFQNFVNTTIDNLDYGNARVGLLLFNENVQVEYHLNTYTKKQDAMQHVDGLIYREGRTNIADALGRARTEMFTSNNGDRDNVPNYLILLTDGVPTVNEAQTLPEAIATRVAGIHIITAAVELKPSNLYLRGIASPPIDTNIFTVDRYQDLEGITENILDGMVDVQNECSSGPCRNGAQCVNGLSQYICLCSGQWTGRNCDRNCGRQRDVIFMLDSSGSLNEVFELQLRLTRSIIYGLNFASSRTRVGAMQWSDNPEVKFNLNQYTDQQSVLNAIAFLRMPGFTDTGRALQLVERNMLSSNAGNRNGIDNVVIVLTDGNSNVNPSNTITQAARLRNAARVIAVGVGASEDINRAEIEEIATNPDQSNTFYVQNEGQVEGVAGNILNEICA